MGPVGLTRKNKSLQTGESETRTINLITCQCSKRLGFYSADKLLKVQFTQGKTTHVQINCLKMFLIFLAKAYFQF